MKTAFAHWDHRIAPVFDTAGHILVVETEGGRMVGETHATLPQDPPVQKALRLVELGIQSLVCGAISRPMHNMVAAYGIQVIPFLAGDLREIIEAWFNGRLNGDLFAMPGCRRREGRRWKNTNERYQEGTSMNPKGRGTGGGGGQGQGRGQGQSQGRGQGQGRNTPRSMGAGSPAAGVTNYCVCPQCGHREPHQRGVPCVQNTCTKCGTVMTRY